jgi:hypothetical protein
MLVFRYLSSIVFLVSFFQANSQGIAINEWRTHLPFSSCYSVTEGTDKIYCATKYAVFSYDKQDQSIERLTKVNALSDIGVSRIQFNKTLNMLVVAYSNGNIDLLENGSVTNISDIKRKAMPGSKIINNILFVGNKAYLSCGFGIVLLDLTKKEIKDTYYIGPTGSHIEVFDMTYDGEKLYAATESGVYEAEINNPFLSNYQSWTKHTEMPNPDGKFNYIVYFKDNLLVNYAGAAFSTDTIYTYNGLQWTYFNKSYSATRCRLNVFGDKLVVVNDGDVEIFDTTFASIQKIYDYSPGIPFPRDMILDNDNVCWIADQNYGLVKNWLTWNYLKITPNGPGTTNVTAMSVEGSKLWVAPGGHNDTWNNVYNRDGVFSFYDETWNTYNKSNTPALDTIYDFISIAVDPSNPSKIYAGSWSRGLLQFTDQSLTAIYTQNNSSLQTKQDSVTVQIGGICFDKDNNMWVANSGVSKAISVRTAAGSWRAFDFNGIVNGNEVGNIIVDEFNQKWAILPRNNGILVFNDNNTISNTSDDKSKKLTTSLGVGNLPSSNIFSIAKDRDGEIWVGTDKGVAVFYTPENVFSGSGFDSQQILVDQGGHIQPLLESEIVTAIAVDGANRKWIGTQRAGVFLVSADGTEQLLHFTEEDSPLLSNTINCITIDQITGEVFFGTGKGIISFKYTSTKGEETFSDVYAYPNPVRENYYGTIAIKGLVTDADVKITDITGTLIYKTIAEGGQAVWNGKNFEGERAHTGVYLVFASNADGTETLVTKILFIN